MASRLSVIFEAVDNISNRLSAIASAGSRAASGFQSVEDAANRAFSGMESDVSAANSAFGQASSAADSLADSINGVGQEALSAARTTEELAEALDESEGAMNEAAEAANEAGLEAEGFERRAGQARDSLGRLTGRTREAGEEAERFGRRARGAGEEAEAFGRVGSEAFLALGSAMVTACIVATLQEIGSALADCAAQAEVFETFVAQLQTIAGAGSIDKLQSDIMELSNSTGQASDALADTAYNAISAGTAVEDSVSMAATASELATAGFTDTSSALSVLETALNSYGDAAGSAEHISDSLITVQNLGVTTVAQLAQQMGKAISTASAYNVSLENLESGYISVTKAGINTAEGTTYLSSMFNELGNTGTEISKLIQRETGKTFGQLMQDGQSLADILGLVYDNCNNDAEAMMNLWGSAEAGKAANAIISQGLEQFNANLSILETTAGTTRDAYSTMADTTAYAHNRMDNAAKNLQTTIGGHLNPALSKPYDAGADIFSGVSSFIGKNPEILQAVAAAGAGLVTVAGILTAVSAAEHAAGLAAEFFNTALLSSPVLWIAGGIAALAVGLISLSAAWDKATDATDGMTSTSKEAEDRLAELNEEYDRACEKYGQNSKEAGALAVQIDELSRKYGDGAETIGQFRERIGELGDFLSETKDAYDENIKSIGEMSGSGVTLVSELQALQSQSELTDGELTLMKSIVGELNSTYGDLGLAVNEATGRMNYSISDLYSYVTEQADLQKSEEASKELVSVLSRYEELKAAKDEALANLDGAKAEYKKAKSEWQDEHPFLKKITAGAEMNWSAELGKAFDAEKQMQEAYQDSTRNYDEAIGQIRTYCDTLGYTSEETEGFIRQLEGASDAAGRVAESLGGAGERTISLEEAVQTAVDSVSTDMGALAEAYDKAYDSAIGSIEGQYSLWDQVKNEATSSVQEINEAMESQIAYWERYASNLDTLSAKTGSISGLGDMLRHMNDGSEESAAALEAMASASDEELGRMVKKYQDLQEAQSKTAGEVADLETEFSSSLNEMSSKLEETVDGMDMADDAAAAARNTMKGYINAIRSMVPSAVSAAEAVSNAATKALGKAYSAKGASPSKIPVPGHAKGTVNSEKAYIAGEEGPELILSGGGDTVFPASETNRIISAVSDAPDNPQITGNPQESGMKGKDPDAWKTGPMEKTLTIRLEGSGAVGVGQGVSPESLWRGIKDNLKQAFMSMLQEEMYEEGAEAHEF